MTALQAVAMAFACFSTIPMPHVEWSERNMRYLMAAFPLVGVVIGLAVWLWGWGMAALGFGVLLRGAGLTLAPLLISGGIHMDGFADVVDAQASHAAPGRKREILKDPHVGAFAVMGVFSYLLAYFALSCEVSTRLLPIVACIPVVSRCLSGFATLTWPPAGHSGMLATMRTGARMPVVLGSLGLMLVLTAGGILWLELRVGAVTLLVAVLAWLWVKRFVRLQFEGMSGDLSGFCLQITELAMLAAVAVAGRLV